MSDQRHQYVAQRLDVALDGIKYSPSIAAFFDNNKVQEELARFYSSDGPECITFLVEKLEDDSPQHKLTFHSGAPKASPSTTRYLACPSLQPDANSNTRSQPPLTVFFSCAGALKQQMRLLHTSRPG